MNIYEFAETAGIFVALLALVKPMGSFMAKVFQGEQTLLKPIVAPCEHVVYRICGVNRDEDIPGPVASILRCNYLRAFLPNTRPAPSIEEG